MHISTYSQKPLSGSKFIKSTQSFLSQTFTY